MQAAKPVPQEPATKNKHEAARRMKAEGAPRQYHARSGGTQHGQHPAKSQSKVMRHLG